MGNCFPFFSTISNLEKPLLSDPIIVRNTNYITKVDKTHKSPDIHDSPDIHTRIQNVFNRTACGLCEKTADDLQALHACDIESIQNTFFCLKCRLILGNVEKS